MSLLLLFNQGSSGLAGTVAATSALSGDLTQVTTDLLAGAVDGASSLSGSLALTESLAGSTAATSTLAGALGLTKPLAGSAAASSTVGAGLGLTTPLAGSVDGSATLSAPLDVTEGAGGITGVISATSALTATLSVEMAIYGYVHLVTPAEMLRPVMGRAIIRHAEPCTAEMLRTRRADAEMGVYIQSQPVGGPAW